MTDKQGKLAKEKKMNMNIEDLNNQKKKKNKKKGTTESGVEAEFLGERLSSTFWSSPQLPQIQRSSVGGQNSEGSEFLNVLEWSNNNNMIASANLSSNPNKTHNQNSMSYEKDVLPSQPLEQFIKAPKRLLVPLAAPSYNFPQKRQANNNMDQDLLFQQCHKYDSNDLKADIPGEISQTTTKPELFIQKEKNLIPITSISFSKDQDSNPFSQLQQEIVNSAFALPPLSFSEEEPRYVNAAQFKRMMIMRIKRAARDLKQGKKPISAEAKAETSSSLKKKYKYESRHKHATNRIRDSKGRFIPKEKLKEYLEQLDREKDHEDNMRLDIEDDTKMDMDILEEISNNTGNHQQN